MYSLKFKSSRGRLQGGLETLPQPMAGASTSREPNAKKVVLFGRTGDGKSTIGNVLVAGGLQPVIFASSDAAKGCTSAIQKESGRGWIVTDTVGLGETDLGTISHTEAKNMVIEFLKEVRDEYSHIIYVQKAGRLTTMDELIWSIFAKVFEGAEDAFVILITAADTGWLDENRDKFPEYWKKHNILATNIPPIDKKPSIEKRLKVIREKSIAQLEKDLEKLFQERGNKYYTPAIAKMNETQLEAKSWSLYDYIVSQIRRLYKKDSWQKVAAQLSSFVNVTSEFVDKYILLGNAVTGNCKQSHGVDKAKPFVPNKKDECFKDTGSNPATLLQDELTSDQGVGEAAPHLSRTFVVEDFLREVNEGGGDGYFVSSQWLLSLPGHERGSLMSCLRTAGYSETFQTTTTILFTRTENDTPKESILGFACPEDIDEGGDDLFEIAREDLNTESNVAVAAVVGSNNPLDTSNSLDQGRNLIDIFPAERQAGVLESFRALLQSKSDQTFCISTMWLSSLEDLEKETLLAFFKEVGYEKISETNKAAWYEKIQGCAGIQAGGACDTDIPSESTRTDVANGQVNQSTVSKLLGFSSRKRMVDCENDASDSSDLEMAMKRNGFKDNSTCHEQVLTVVCLSSTSRTPGELLQEGDFYRQQFGHSVGKWPISKCEDISTSIEKSFRIPTLHFPTDQGASEVLMNLRASATISLSCCIKIGHCSPKILIKFSRISAEVKNEEAEEEIEESQGEPQEEFCNAIGLSYLCTNVYSGCQSKQVLLHLGDEYDSPPGIRLVLNNQHLWFEKSGVTPINPDPGSTSLVLRCDAKHRRQCHSGMPRLLYFQETRPVIFEGHIKESLLQNSFLKFHIRHKLEVSYFRPSRPILKLGSAWSANIAAKVIDFDCFFEIRTDNMSVG